MKILIWGTGKSATNLFQRLREEVQVEAFIDSYKKQEKFCDREVILPNQAYKYQYDYILIASVYVKEIKQTIKTLGIDEEKVLLIKDLENGIFDGAAAYWIHNKDFFKNRIKDFDDYPKLSEVLVTGISYHNDGICSEGFTMKNLFNLALRGEDIFYNFEVIKYLFRTYEEKMAKVKYCIIGLSYYSFEYDMSKSINAWEIERYYPMIQTAHNWVEDTYFAEMVEEQRQILKQFSHLNEVVMANICEPINYEVGEQTAKRDFNKKYPSTVRENKMILASYISFLLQREITPIIVIMPVTKYYRKFVLQENKDMFYHNLEEVLKSYPQMQILDYFDTYDLQDEYWYHVNHLNKKGAFIFSKQLEKDINW